MILQRKYCIPSDTFLFFFLKIDEMLYFTYFEIFYECILHIQEKRVDSEKRLTIMQNLKQKVKKFDLLFIYLIYYYFQISMSMYLSTNH